MKKKVLAITLCHNYWIRLYHTLKAISDSIDYVVPYEIQEHEKMIHVGREMMSEELMSKNVYETLDVHVVIGTSQARDKRDDFGKYVGFEAESPEVMQWLRQIKALPNITVRLHHLPKERFIDKPWFYNDMLHSSTLNPHKHYAIRDYNLIWHTDSDVLHNPVTMNNLMQCWDSKSKITYFGRVNMAPGKTQDILDKGFNVLNWGEGLYMSNNQSVEGTTPFGYCMLFHPEDYLKIIRMVESRGNNVSQYDDKIKRAYKEVYMPTDRGVYRRMSGYVLHMHHGPQRKNWGGAKKLC